MKRFVSLLALVVLAVTTIGAGFVTRRRDTGGVSSTISAQYPWSGTLAITIDDSPRWVYQNLDTLLTRINADSGLTNTPYEMHVTAFMSVDSINGMRGWHGQDGTQGCTNGADTCRCSKEEAQAMKATGLVEIGSHAYWHNSLGPFESQERPKGIWSLSPFGGTPDQTIQQDIAGSYSALVDSMGLGPIRSLGAPNHIMSGQALEIAARYYTNWRSGLLLPSGADVRWPADNTQRTAAQQSTNIQRGAVLHFNRSSLDNVFYWMNNYSPLTLTMWGPTFPGDRLAINNTSMGNEAGGTDSTIAMSQYAIALCADQKALMVWTWHRQNIAGNPAPNYGGLAGVEAVLRTAAHYCRNGALMRDGPKLQVLTLDEAMNKRLNYSYLGGPVNVIDNPKMLSDISCGREDSTRVRRPYAYSRRMESIWADSLWYYHNPADVMATGGWFSPNANDGTTMTAIDSASTAGVFGTTKDRAASYKPLILYFPVVPNSHAKVWLQACTSETDQNGTWYSNDGGTATPDSLSSDWIDIQVTPFGFSQLATDTTAVLERIAGLGGVVNVMQGHAETGWITRRTNDWTAVASQAGVHGSARMQGRFHMCDGWIYQRSAGFSSSYFEDGVNADATHAKTIRWREFMMWADIPADCYYVQVVLRPMGFVHAAGGSATDSLAISGLEIQCTPR